MENLQLKAEPSSAAELLVKLAQRGCAWQRLFGQPRGLRIAVNKSFAELETLVQRSDEVAFVASGGPG